MLSLILIEQGGYNHGNQGNHGKIMENSGNFVKLSPNQGTLHFCQTGDIKKKNQEEKEMKQNLKKEKRLKFSYKS